MHLPDSVSIRCAHVTLHQENTAGKRINSWIRFHGLYCQQKRGLNLSCSCCDRYCVQGEGGGCGWCTTCGGETCIAAAERLDCHGPDSQACLDSVCPSKQVCFTKKAVPTNTWKTCMFCASVGAVCRMEMHTMKCSYVPGPGMQSVVWSVLELLCLSRGPGAVSEYIVCCTVSWLHRM